MILLLVVSNVSIVPFCIPVSTALMKVLLPTSDEAGAYIPSISKSAFKLDWPGITSLALFLILTLEPEFTEPDVYPSKGTKMN